MAKVKKNSTKDTLPQEEELVPPLPVLDEEDDSLGEVDPEDEEFLDNDFEDPDIY